MKISELMDEYNKITKKAERQTFKSYKAKLIEKQAFVPNPDVAAQQQQGQPPQGQPPQGQPPQGQPPQGDPAAQQQAAQQPPQGDPAAQGQPPAQGQEQPSELMQEIMAAFEKMPPEAQQHIAPLIQQLQSMPPEEREKHLQGLVQEMMAGAQQQPGMEAQASEEDMLAAMQGGMPPQASGPSQLSHPEETQQDAEQAESSAIEAKNELDNVKVNLSVRELLDLVGKGQATASLLKVKQLADTHKQKMDQTRQKAESDQQQQAQESQQSQQSAGMMDTGGIYGAPMGTAN